MIDWLAKISGRNNSQNAEKEELKNLRKEITKLKKMVSKIILLKSVRQIRRKNS